VPAKKLLFVPSIDAATCDGALARFATKKFAAKVGLRLKVTKDIDRKNRRLVKVYAPTTGRPCARTTLVAPLDLGLSGKSQIRCPLPPLGGLPIVLVGTLQRLLQRKPEVRQQFADRGKSEANAKLLVNQLGHHGARPQTEETPIDLPWLDLHSVGAAITWHDLC
jgi:hypothetical protein